ncbi:MAG: preprotein translocase subunit SecE [Candidatus Omnitrophica bacterium CG1_02_49_16]|nr:MAG: preprotein translocase subunit SecE [Candidatus Omnitrophica bacterium CG1_02_49_16]
MIKKIKSFIAEVRAEMQKVTWPTREELTGSTGVVLVTMFFLSAFIGVADFILSYALAVIMR